MYTRLCPVGIDRAGLLDHADGCYQRWKGVRANTRASRRRVWMLSPMR